MRFDEFLARNGLAVSPVDRFDGLAVNVGVPSDWDPFDSTVGIGVWVRRSDPRIDEFCANAVLTLHHVKASLDAGEVFAMLSEQQLQSLPATHEVHRELAAATEEPGVTGVLAMQISHELGILDSTSRARIISTNQQTLIAQLTVTALQDSPVEREKIWLSVRLGAVASPPIANNGGVPMCRLQDRS